MSASRPQGTQVEADQVVAGGGLVVYWREGCPFCKRLDQGLGEAGQKALWVNVWEDSAASDFVKSVNDGNEVVPTVRTAEKTYVAASAQTVCDTAAFLAGGK